MVTSHGRGIKKTLDQLVKGTWLLNSVVSGTFADHGQEADLQCLRNALVKARRSTLVKVQRSVVPAGVQSGAGAGARVCHGDVMLSRT